MKSAMILFLSISILLVGAGCSTQSITQKTQKGITVPKLEVHGAVIEKCDNKYIYYKKKCLFCGFISPKTIGSAFPSAFTINTKFECPRCGNNTNVIIRKHR